MQTVPLHIFQQKLFQTQSNWKEHIESTKEHWGKLQDLLFSKNKENVVMGMNLLEALDKKIYLDALCSFFEFTDDASISPKIAFKSNLLIQNPQALAGEIIRVAEDETNKEHFVHISGLIDEIREGDVVEFDLTVGKKGLNAVNVKVV